MKNGPTWKWIVIMICLPLIGFLGNQIFNNVGAEVKNLKVDQEKGFMVLHKRISELDECKVDEKVWELQNKHMIETLNEIKADVKDIKRRPQR